MSDGLIEAGLLTLRVTRIDRVLSVEAYGELDLTSSQVLKEQLALGADGDVHQVVLDLSGLEFIDSTGVAEIVRAHKTLGDGTGKFCLRRGSGQVAEVITLAGLDRTLHFLD